MLKNIRTKKILKGFTLVEIMVVSCLVTVLLGAFISLYVQGGYDFARGFSCLEIHGDARISMDWLAKDLRSASQILASASFSGHTYTSGINEIVFQVPSTDSGGDVVANRYDTIAYHLNNLDPKKLERIVDADSASSRQSNNRLIAKSIRTINFTYNNPDVTKATLVGLSLTTGKAILGNKLYLETLNSTVKLRNKAI